MKRPFDVILFDLGSTLIYFNGDFDEILVTGYARCYSALHVAGLHLERGPFLQRFKELMDEYRRERETEFIEYTTYNILKLALAEFGYPAVPDNLIRQAVATIYQLTQQYWEVEPDAHATLKQLQQEGYHLGLVSNAGDEPDVQTLIDRAGLRPYFEVILVSAELGIRKPHPRIFEQALQYWGVPPRRAAMVGDTLGADILGAHNAGLYSIWITRRADSPGNRAHAGLIIPDAEISALAGLPALLRVLEGDE